MATMRRRNPELGFAVSPDRPLVGIAMVENGQEVIRYFVDDEQADAAIAADLTADAHSLAGAWADLDWGEAIDALERIRHESTPTPPIDAL